MIRLDFGFTHHAVSRYMERVRPGADVQMALRDLHASTVRAKPIDRRTRSGQKVWLVDVPPMRLVTKPEGKGLVVVTVLDGHDGGEDEAIEEVAEAYRRLQSVPAAGTEEVTSPGPRTADKKPVGHWIELEKMRLATERERLKVVNRSIVADEEMRKRVLYRNALLCEAAKALEKIDQIGNAELLAEIRRATTQKHT